MAVNDGYELGSEDMFAGAFLILPGRHKLCGYNPAAECVSSLTRVETNEFVKNFADNSCMHHGVSIGSCEVAGTNDNARKLIFGIAGRPQQIANILKCKLRLSQSARYQVCLFIIGACYIDD
jgi:hypothetical protein